MIGNGETYHQTGTDPKEMSSSSHWYVINSKPKKEDVVLAYLNSLGVETFLPRIRRKILFPTYLFVRCNLSIVGVHKLKWGQGLGTGIVLSDQNSVNISDAIIVADEAIEKLKQKLINPSSLDDNVNPLSKGKHVFIRKGPFKGFSGTVGDIRSNKIVVVVQTQADSSIKLEMSSGDVYQI